jgi:hypothetical protein
MQGEVMTGTIVDINATSLSIRTAERCYNVPREGNHDLKLGDRVFLAFPSGWGRLPTIRKVSDATE